MKVNLIIVVLFSIFFGTSLLAETAYVYDKGKVWTRSGPTKDFRVNYKVLPGTKLDILSENSDTGYTQVKDFIELISRFNF